MSCCVVQRGLLGRYTIDTNPLMPCGHFGLLQCEFERRKPDGTTTLGLLHPVDPVVGGGFAELDPQSLLWAESTDLVPL